MEIAQSQNTKAELVDKATSFIGMATYGQIMIGNKAFEFYGDNVNHYLQIPWDEVIHFIPWNLNIVFGIFRIVKLKRFVPNHNLTIRSSSMVINRFFNNICFRI